MRMITLIICLEVVSVWAGTVKSPSKGVGEFTLPLYGSTSSSSSKMMMYYYMHMYVGSNYQQQSYIIDTTSSITTSPCKPLCVRCGKHRYDYYEIQDVSSIIPCNSNECSVLSSSSSSSSTLTSCNDYNQCSFDYVFSEGSMFSGVYVNEQIHFSSEEKNNNSSSSLSTSSSTHIPIGCTSSERLSFYAQNENGIISLSNSNTSFINTLYTKGIINQNIFSLCLSKTGNGYISIGSIDNAYHSKSSHSQIFYIPLHNPTDPHYTLEIKKLTLNNNVSISTNNNNIAVIDSSSVISYIPNMYFDQIVNTLNEVICVNDNCGKYKLHNTLGICYVFDNNTHLYESVQAHWPIITFGFDKNVQYTLKPLNYVYNNTISSGGHSNSNRYEACFGLVSTNDNVFTFGMNWMNGYDVIFDKGNKRIGFIEADCTRNNTFVQVGGDEESHMKWNEMVENDSDDNFEEEENEEKKVSKDDHNETVVNSNDDDDIKDESISLINDNQSKVLYMKLYVFIGICLFIIILIIVYFVFRLIYKNKRNNMVRLEEEHESRTNNKHKPEIESEVEIASEVEIVVQQQQQQ